MIVYLSAGHLENEMNHRFETIGDVPRSEKQDLLLSVIALSAVGSKGSQTNHSSDRSMLLAPDPVFTLVTAVVPPSPSSPPTHTHTADRPMLHQLTKLLFIYFIASYLTQLCFTCGFLSQSPDHLLLFKPISVQ
ncbi:hypothetical protein J6590_010189 [Homalodisca vitripennis]|nr:hypothetical protein J6590_010189 [Homalodisca vitripennis]